MIVIVRMDDGTKRVYALETDEPFESVMGLVKEELPDAKTILTLVPNTERMAA
jgi:hypothetical protein